MKRLALFAALLFAAGCELGPTSSASDNVSVNSRAENGGCPASLNGGGAAGASCQVSGDCAEVCCSCASGAGYAASACVNNSCADVTTTCSKAQSSRPDVCP